MSEDRPDAPAGAPVEGAADWLASGGFTSSAQVVPEVEVVPDPEHLPPLRRGQPIPKDLRFPDGTANPYAVMVESRRRADAYYLDVFAITGDHDEAARQTCSTYGHDARAARCLRCGIGTRGYSAQRVRSKKTRQPRSAECCMRGCTNDKADGRQCCEDCRPFYDRMREELSKPVVGVVRRDRVTAVDHVPTYEREAEQGDLITRRRMR